MTSTAYGESAYSTLRFSPSDLPLSLMKSQWTDWLPFPDARQKPAPHQSASDCRALLGVCQQTRYSFPVTVTPSGKHARLVPATSLFRGSRALASAV
jgi:hypothetical protein